MPLLRTKPTNQSRFELRSQAGRRCPMLRYTACWCRGLCQPQEGLGACGLQAPHAMMDRTQTAIARGKGLLAQVG